MAILTILTELTKVTVITQLARITFQTYLCKSAFQNTKYKISIPFLSEAYFQVATRPCLQERSDMTSIRTADMFSVRVANVISSILSSRL